MPISGNVFSVWQPPTEPGQAAKESCTMQAIIAGVVGGGAGMVLGAVLAPFNSSVTNLENSDLPMREQFRRGGREIAAQSRSWGKNLLVIGGIFSCTECFVEKTRGRHDRWNPIVGGCLTGGILAASGACQSASPRIAHASHPFIPLCSTDFACVAHARASMYFVQLDRRQWA